MKHMGTPKVKVSVNGFPAEMSESIPLMFLYVGFLSATTKKVLTKSETFKYQTKII